MKLIVDQDREYSWLDQKLNGDEFNWDIQSDERGGYHIILDNKSYSAEIVDFDRGNKTFQIVVNGSSYEVAVKDRFDQLLESLGIEGMGANKVEDIKAPMPGLVLDIMVEAGQEVKAGDAVLVLEAMKMENVLKAASEGTVESVAVNKGDAVEKNQLLIKMA